MPGVLKIGEQDQEASGPCGCAAMLQLGWRYHSVQRLAAMLHNELITEFPCDGELFRVEERCTRWLTVLRCQGCTTEISFEPDSSQVFIVTPGMRSDLSDFEN